MRHPCANLRRKTAATGSRSSMRSPPGGTPAATVTRTSPGSRSTSRPPALADRAGAGREPVLAHRPPVADRDRVELEVQLGGEVERHLLGPLRFDDALVLVEDRVLERLQHLDG